MANDIYNLGFTQAEEQLKTMLVNGIDEFQKLPVLINCVVRMLETPANANPKVYYEGVVDACTQAWDAEKKIEIQELELESREVADEYKEMLKHKKSA